MSGKLKLLAALNIVGWAIVVPLLVSSLIHPLLDFKGWPGSELLGRPAEESPLAQVPPPAVTPLRDLIDPSDTRGSDPDPGGARIGKLTPGTSVRGGSTTDGPRASAGVAPVGGIRVAVPDVGKFTPGTASVPATLPEITPGDESSEADPAAGGDPGAPTTPGVGITVPGATAPSTPQPELEAPTTGGGAGPIAQGPPKLKPPEVPPVPSVPPAVPEVPVAEPPTSVPSETATLEPTPAETPTAEATAAETATPAPAPTQTAAPDPTATPEPSTPPPATGGGDDDDHDKQVPTAQPVADRPQKHELPPPDDGGTPPGDC